MTGVAAAGRAVGSDVGAGRRRPLLLLAGERRHQNAIGRGDGAEHDRFEQYGHWELQVVKRYREGRSGAQGRACSSCAASLNRVASSPNRAMN